MTNLASISTYTGLSAFGSAEQVLKEGRTLLRLVSLDKAREKTPSVVDDVHAVWTNALSQLEKLQFGVVEAALSDPRMQKVKKLYAEDVKGIESVEKIRALANDFLKDRASLVIAPRLKSKVGDEGPTFIVSYPREVASDQICLVEYVMKWTNQLELDSHRLYEAFSAGFSPNANICYGFSVPAMAEFDFENGVHSLADGRPVKIDQKLSREIRSHFLKVGGKHRPSDDYTRLMLMQKVPGENLRDFVKSKYALLDERQKSRLFKHIGRLCLLDLVFGHDDRFVHLDEAPRSIFGADESEDEEAPLVFSETGVNLGNIMIDWTSQPQEDPYLYAIDNGIEPRYYDEEGREALSLFLSNSVGSPQFVPDLAKNIMENLKITSDYESLDPLEADLEPIALPAFEKGIQEMFRYLRGPLITRWIGEEGRPLQERLNATSPQLIELINERLKVITG